MKLDEIANREDISSSFLVQILNELKRAGIVASKRGKAGGYVLSRPPAAISLGEVVQSIEPTLLTVPTASPGNSGPAIASIWEGLSLSITERLNSTSLESIASDTGAPMYFI